MKVLENQFTEAGELALAKEYAHEYGKKIKKGEILLCKKK